MLPSKGLNPLSLGKTENGLSPLRREVDPVDKQAISPPDLSVDDPGDHTTTPKEPCLTQGKSSESLNPLTPLTLPSGPSNRLSLKIPPVNPSTSGSEKFSKTKTLSPQLNCPTSNPTVSQPCDLLMSASKPLSPTRMKPIVASSMVSTRPKEVSTAPIHPISLSSAKEKPTSSPHQEPWNFTLKPYVPSSTSSTMFTERRKGKPSRTYKKVDVPIRFANTASITLPSIHQFLILRASSNPLPTNLEKLFRKIHSHSGTSRFDVNPQKDGSLVIKSRTPSETSALLSLKNIDDSIVSITPHPHLNKCQGTIYAARLLPFTVEELQEDLAPQGVTEVKRLTSRVQGVITESPRLLLTFNSLVPPPYVLWGMGDRRSCEFSVRQYIPPPTRCFGCNRFGHVSKNCRQTTTTCVRCGQPSHPSACNTTPNCINCSGPHPASSKECPRYIQENEIQHLRYTAFLSARDARDQVRSRQRQQDVSYAAAATSNTTPQPPRKQVLMPTKTNNQAEAIATPARSISLQDNPPSYKPPATNSAPLKRERERGQRRSRSSLNESEVILPASPTSPLQKKPVRNRPSPPTPSPPRKRGGPSPPVSPMQTTALADVHQSASQEVNMLPSSPINDPLDSQLAIIHGHTNILALPLPPSVDLSSPPQSPAPPHQPMKPEASSDATDSLQDSSAVSFWYPLSSPRVAKDPPNHPLPEERNPPPPPIEDPPRPHPQHPSLEISPLPQRNRDPRLRSRPGGSLVQSPVSPSEKRIPSHVTSR